MKHLTLNIFVFIALLLGSINIGYSQSINCYANLNVSLGPTGSADLIPEMMLEGPHSDFDSLWLDINQLNCDNIGNNTITVFGLHQSGQTLSCFSTILLEDKLDPIAYAYNGSVVILDANDQYVLTPSDVDAGSFDNCNNLNITLSPAIITCGMPNPVEVTMTVADDSGNSAYAVANVYYEDDDINALACNDLVDISFPTALQHIVTPSEVIEGFSGSCPSAYWLELEVNGQLRPNNTLTSADFGASIVYALNGGNGLTCWGNINAFSLDCPHPFTEDMIDWPAASLNVPYDICEYENFTVTPESLINDGGFPEGDVLPLFNPGATCLFPVHTYSDLVIDDLDSTKVIRTWTVLEWVNNVTFTFTQVITVINDLPVICDTQPWNTPFGDCTTGHSQDDIVEWPADITIDITAHLPSQLANNPTVNTNDVEPQIFYNNECGLLNITFSDNVIKDPADLSHQVERTWNIYGLFSLIGSYTQTISIESNTTSMFCAYRRNGDAIPDVLMAPGFSTDASGCVDLSNYNGDLIEPSKESPAADGVDINDKIAIWEDILYVNPFDNFYQDYAADLNLNGNVTTLDYVLVDRMITGLFVPDRVWTFFDIVDGGNKQFINISENNPLNTFIGVKTGDVNDSYNLDNFNGNPNETDLFVTDEVLNNGMLYRVPMYNPVNEKIQGFTVNFENNENIKIYNVFAPLLKDFNLEDNVLIKGNKVTIDYVAPEEELKEGGILVQNSAPLITLMIEATNNGILSEELHFIDDENNLLKSERFDEAAQIKLDWEGIIVNKIDEPLPLVEMSLSPNPTSGLIEIRFDQSLSASTFKIFDLQGRNLIVGQVDQNTINVNNLEAGIYALEINFKDGSKAIQKFIKI